MLDMDPPTTDRGLKNCQSEKVRWMLAPSSNVRN